MVVPTRKTPSPSFLNSKTRTLLLVVALTIVGWLVLSLSLSHQPDDESSLHWALFPSVQQQQQETTSRYPPLDCEKFLDGIRDNWDDVDPNNGTLFASYLTNYHPPFWISNPQHDRETVRTGWYSDDPYNHTQRLEKILEKKKYRLIFVQPQDWGWFPLFGASHAHAVTVVVPPHRNLTHTTVRLCEALRLNRWTPQSKQRKIRDKISSSSLSPPAAPSFQIFHQPTIEQLANEWAQQQQQQQQQTTQEDNAIALLLKIEGPDILKILQQTQNLLSSGRVEYIWLEWEKKQNPNNNAEEIVKQIMISNSKLYEPWWPVVSQNNDLLSKHVEEKCSSSCSLWWKRI